MKASDIKDLTVEELKDKLVEMQNNLGKMTLNHSISPLENPMLIRSTRRGIARIKTEIKKRELANK